MSKVIIAGGRDFNNYELLKEKCDYYLKYVNVKEIVSGKQVTIDEVTKQKYGADYLGEQYAIENKIHVQPFHADWNKLKRAAGPVRNEQMAKYSDYLIAFWDGKSKGTSNMIDNAKKYNLKIRIVRY